MATPKSAPPRWRDELDIDPVTVLALTWLAAIVATSLTLWLLIGVIGNV